MLNVWFEYSHDYLEQNTNVVQLLIFALINYNTLFQFMNFQFYCIITKLHIITKLFYNLTIQFCIYL